MTDAAITTPTTRATAPLRLSWVSVTGADGRSRLEARWLHDDQAVAARRAA